MSKLSRVPLNMVIQIPTRRSNYPIEQQAREQVCCGDPMFTSRNQPGDVAYCRNARVAAASIAPPSDTTTP